MENILIKVINMSVTAGWVVLALVAVRLIFRKLPKRALCALWGIVGLRLVLPYSLKSVLSLIPSTQTVTANNAGSPVINSGFTAFNTVVNPIISTQTAVGEPIAAQTPWDRFLAAAPYLWLCGAALMLAWALIGYLRVRRGVRESIPAEKGVYLCDRLPSPFILGVFRPRIYLPAHLPEDRREFILTHEKTHVRRRDQLWKPLGYLLLSVYWFNPLLWVAYILLCRDIEAACDERVIRDYSDRERALYSQTLLDFSAPGRIVSACPVAFGETGVKERVKSVLSYKKPTIWIIAAAVVLSLVLAVVFLTDPKKKGAPKNAEEAAGEYIVTVSSPKPLGSGASFTLSEDGTFRFSLGVAISFMPSGDYTIDRDGTLTLNGIEDVKYVFTWNGKGYAYNKEKSGGDGYGIGREIADGTVFVPASVFDGHVFFDSGSDEAKIKIEECTLKGDKKQVAFRFINNSDKSLFYGLDHRLFVLTNDGTDAEEIELPPHTLLLYAVNPGKTGEKVVFSVPDGLDLTKTFRLETYYCLAEDENNEADQTVYTATVFFGGLESAQTPDDGNIASQFFDIDGDGEAEAVEIERSVNDGRDMTVLRVRKGSRILGELCIPFIFASDLAFYPDAQIQPTIRAKLDNREMYGKQPGNDIVYLNLRLDDGMLRLFNTISGDEFPWINKNTTADPGTSYIITDEADSPAQRIRFSLNPKGNSFRMTFGTEGDYIEGNYKEAEDGTLTLIYDNLGTTETFVFTGGQHVFNREKSSSDADGRLKDGAWFQMLLDAYETDVNGDGEKEWLYLADGGTSGFCTYTLIAENSDRTLFREVIPTLPVCNLSLSEFIDGSVRIKSDRCIRNVPETNHDDGYYITEFIDVKLQRGGFHFYYAGTDMPYVFANV